MCASTGYIKQHEVTKTYRNAQPCHLFSGRALLRFVPLPLSSSRLAAHCIERQSSPIGTDSGDALAPQQVADNLISSLSSHLPPVT